MTQYNSLNVKLSNSQLSKLKSAIKNETDVVLRLSSNMIGNSGDSTNFPHELLLTNRQVLSLRKAFAKNISTDIKLSKTQLSKMIQSGGFLGKLLGPLLRTGLPLRKSVIKPLAKSVLIPVGLTAAASAADAGIHKRILGSGNNNNTILRISNNEMDDILKIVKSLEYSGVLLKGVTETIQNEAKEQRGGFLSMFLGTLGASLLGDVLTKNLSGKGVIRAGERRIRAGYGSNRSSLKKFLTPRRSRVLGDLPHTLTNFEIQAYYQNEPRFDGVFSRDNLPNTIKNGAYVINLDEYRDIGTHWVALYVNNKTVTYFDSFGVEHIPRKIIKFIESGFPDNKNMITNIYRIQPYDSIIYGYFCIGFINFMFNGNSLTYYTNLFSPNDFKKNDDILLKYFSL